MNDFGLLIPAAGKGKRAQLPFPKTLFRYKSVPILHRILKKTKFLNAKPIIIASSKGSKTIAKYLSEHNFKYEIILQKKQIGMLDAVMKVKNYSNYRYTENFLLIWGDICNPQTATLRKICKLHKKDHNDLSIVSHLSNFAYTKIVKSDNKIIRVDEMKNKLKKNIINERDTGIFVISKKYINFLNHVKKKCIIDNEYSFLESIKYAVKQQLIVRSYLIAKSKDCISFNQQSDLHK